MSLHYTLRDAERWAAFSGDYNPIHFDAAEAKLLGMEDVCVHGMRAMLDVKSRLSRALEKQTLSSGGLLFSCRLRDPVACENPYQLALNHTQSDGLQQVTGKLRHAHTQALSLSSKLSESHSLALTPGTQAITLQGEALSTLYRQFQTIDSQSAPLWSFYDAVLFRQLVNAPETLATVQSLLPGHKATSLKDVFSLARVVQTHHETRFSPLLLANAEEGSAFEPLHYSVLPTLVMGEKGAGLVLVAGIEAWRDNQPLLSVSATLKTGPLAE
ncbi:MaoC/PaaZ C-terminal domain-containing protein [Enterobacter sp. UNJFSC 003]|uniref:MaoC/PaaZ C-terminal domain-containing protein n=1 Tax=Enterobacter sp. UNJFSC 003 TaxID=3122077 RepID=UPI002EC0F62A|nr:MaoC/PaaZ C-terminal domain-containing protein [Serratia liquefaciens]